MRSALPGRETRDGDGDPDLTRRVRYEAPRTLGRFIRDDSFVRCVVGPVGSGKSSACVMELLVRAAKQKPGPDGVRRSRWAVIRNTYPQLRDTTRKTFEQWIPPDVGRWHEQSFSFVIDAPCRDGSRIHSEILFRALDRPEDVKKLLSLELTGAYINEAREVPKHVFDVLQTRIGRYPSKSEGGATWFGIWMDTNPWHTGHWGYKLFSRERPAGYALFEQPGGRSERAENVPNLPPGYYDRLIAGKDSEWVKSYVDGGYPSHDIGSVYGRLIETLEREGRVAEFEHPSDGVFTAWDLGISDSTAIWFFRIGSKGVPDVVDFYEAHGEAASHYFALLARKGYAYTTHWFPPTDGPARTWQTGIANVQLLRDWCRVDTTVRGTPAIAPDLGLADGIGAARWLLEQPIRIHTRCGEGLERLRAYHYEWDESAQTFGRRPEHDFSSHASDAFRYMASVAQMSDRMAKRADNAAKRPQPKGDTLDRLWELQDRESQRY